MSSSSATTMPTANNYALATDLDGTLIPLPGEPLQRWACARLKFLLRHDGIPFTFATGRHFDSAFAAIAEHGLPVPQWIVCNVGTDIHVRREDGSFECMHAFQAHLAELTQGVTTALVREAVSDFDALQLQPEATQGDYKLSFFVAPAVMESMAEQLRQRMQERGLHYEVMTSLDPSKADGLIDLLPAGVHKAHAVVWLADFVGFSPDHVIYAGDSGNDYAALTHGFRAIVVQNASPGLADKVEAELASAGKDKRCFYHSPYGATAAVLDGCLHYGLFEGEAETLRGFPEEGGPWRSPVGVCRASGTHTVWAPRTASLKVLPVAQEPRELVAMPGGYWRVATVDSEPYFLETSEGRLPDPCACSQPEGVHGPSQVVTLPKRPREAWCQDLLPSSIEALVIYELHVGTFTVEGTYAAAQARLPQLKALGVTAVELMPLAQAAGDRNWGYDGVFPFAPQAAYGSIEALGAFIDEAHRLGLLVIHDVVYNHLGPEGNYLARFGPYFRSDRQTPWGGALDFDQPAVRDYFISNALYWLGEIGFDGLRLDAIAIYYDETEPRFLDELREAVDALGQSQGRKLWLFGEENVFHARDLESRPDGSALDAIWTDDFGHALLSTLTGERHHGGRKYEGASDLALALTQTALYRRDGLDGVTRMSPQSDLPRERFVIGIQNHDWVGNDPHGRRLAHLCGREAQMVGAALTLLSPGIPLLFMGEEYAESAPFLFFTDFSDEGLRRAVDEGRRREHATKDWSGALDASDPRAFEVSKLRDFDRGDEGMRAWYTELLRFRRRGVADGWLRRQQLTVQAHPEHREFHLQYSQDGATVVTLSVWLSAACELPDGLMRRATVHSAETRFGGTGAIACGPLAVLSGPLAAVGESPCA